MILEPDVDKVVEEDTLDAVEEVMGITSTTTTMVSEDTLNTTNGERVVVLRDKTATRTNNSQG